MIEDRPAVALLDNGTAAIQAGGNPSAARNELSLGTRRKAPRPVLFGDFDMTR
jgi:hypothetical protein